jgi:hypothetical protein
MKTTPMKYNPAFLSRDELVRSFVVRTVDLNLIVETVKENTGNSNQHVFIIGPRGMGKTMLALRVAAHLDNDKKLSAGWYPIIFSEESYEIATAAEFWLRAVFHLAGQTGDEDMAGFHDKLKKERDEKRLYEQALACLMDFADQQQKRLLLVVENINMLLDEQISADESWNLRHTLLNEPRIMLLATAVTRFDEIDNSGRAMFDLFKTYTLEPLDTKEAQTLWESLTGHKVQENRIRPIQILTGGNPRLLAIISSFAAGASFRELMKQLTFLIDEYTTYFKSNIESLPSLERKIFVTLANIWEPATAAQVAGDARIDVNKASSLLKRLESRGSVCVVKASGRKKSYQVTERLYNIYHLMRLSGSQSGRVRAVVDFMVTFYEGEELAKMLSQLTEEACGLEPETPGNMVSDHYPSREEEPDSTYYKFSNASILGKQTKWEKALSIAAEFLKDPNTGDQFPNDIIAFFTDAAAAGFAKEGLKVLQNSPCAPYVEPLIVGLQMMTGEEYNAPLEVVETAKDVVKRIGEKKKGIYRA